MSALSSPLVRERSFLERSLTTMPVNSPRCVTLPAPRGLPERLLRAADPRALLLASGSEGIAGIGASIELRASGPARFDAIRHDASQVFERLVHVSAPLVKAPAPRFYGGFAFDEGAATSKPWEHFGDALFVMPRWTYGCQGGTAWLRLTLPPGDEGATAPSEYADHLHRLDAELGCLTGTSFRRRTTETREEYDSRIEDLRSDITAGRFEKVVAARRLEVDLADEVDDLVPLHEFRQRFPACTRFAFRIGDATFLGATPERLVRRRGLRVETVALAGTVPHGQHEALLASTKDSKEHRLVVDAIHDALQGAVDLAPAAPSPSVRELANVLHLETPIEGTLKSVDTHILSLVQSMHPTPAVGGVPRDAAREHIRNNESQRGWYASPIGSFDAAGEGDFSVALRCGVLSKTRAFAYAGGGIVEDSRADLEYLESELKLEAFLGALGAGAERHKH